MRARRLIKKSLEIKENKLYYYIYIESFVLAKYSTLPTKMDLININV
jgi:hypothetical protein